LPKFSKHKFSFSIGIVISTLVFIVSCQTSLTYKKGKDVSISVAEVNSYFFVPEYHKPNCSEFNGQTKFINWTKDISPTKVPAHYWVKEIEKNIYEVGFNIFFKDFDESFLKKISNCLKKAEPFLNDGTGRQIRLTILFSKAEIFFNGVKTIKIVPTEEAINTRNYSSSMTCVAIVHELLHNTGLVDEYDVKNAYSINDLAYGTKYSSNAFDCGPQIIKNKTALAPKPNF